MLPPPLSSNPFAASAQTEALIGGTSPPSAAHGKPLPWEAPVPLAETAPVPPFPLEVLPPALVTFVQEARTALDLPVDLLGPALLAVAGAAIGTSRALHLKDNHCESAALYLAVVAPGGRQTAALQTVTEPVHEAQGQLLTEYETRLAEYEKNLTRYRPPNRRPRVVFPWEEDLYAVSEKPKRPILSRLAATETPATALPLLLQENPRGLLMIRHDLLVWLARLGAGGTGQRGERQLYQAAWTGEPICLDHGGRAPAPMRVPRPFLGMVGGLDPERLAVLRQERARVDNLLDRFLFTFPDPWPAAKWNRQVLKPGSRQAWTNILAQLRYLQPEAAGTGSARPEYVRFHDEGGQAWGRLFDRLTGEINGRDFPEHLRGPWTRLQSYAARLALVLHLLWWAGLRSDRTSRPRNGPAAFLAGASVERAGWLINYFKQHTRKVYACLGADVRVTRARLVLRWIERQKLSRFSRRDAHHALWGTFPTVDRLEPILDLLLLHGYLRQQADPERTGPGRKPSPVYEVNPLGQKLGRGARSENTGSVQSGDRVEEE